MLERKMIFLNLFEERTNTIFLKLKLKTTTIFAVNPYEKKAYLHTQASERVQ